ncbi:WD40 repeat domain-containing protein [Streptomyces sp. NPDC006872]|uniref:WD40 repeat domain-containing protein n=1 Tax=Streptomyces sp. NPDC006872 TaxID=3155720 RepID=UPI003405A4F6
MGVSSGALHIVDASTRTSTRIGSVTGHRSTVTALAFSADASRIAAYADGEVRIWDKSK